MRKSKKQKRKEKQEKLYNKRMIKKYPWLRPVKWGRGLIEIRDNKFDYTYIPIFNHMTGWWRAFGKMFCDEIQAEFHDNPDLYVLDYKEKWGALNLYFGGISTDSIQNIVDKYEHLSMNICFMCGKPDVYMTNTGWLLPICKDCFEKSGWSNKSYEESVCGEQRMSDEIVWKSSDGEKHIDISDTAEKIRDQWRRKYGS